MTQPAQSPRTVSTPSVMRSEKVSEKVARRMVADIVGGGLRPGSMLPSEAIMLEQYGVGRASLREAIRLLEVYGVIWVKAGPRGGPVVGALKVKDFGRSAALHFQLRGATMNQLLEARLSLEPMMARLAAERIDPEGAAALKAQIAAGHDALVHTADWGNSSSDFHELIGSLSSNVMLDLFSNSLSAIQNERIKPIFPPNERGDVLKVHERIANAIVAGNGATAERLMRKHLEALIDRIRVALPGLLDEVIEWR